MIVRLAARKAADAPDDLEWFPLRRDNKTLQQGIATSLGKRCMISELIFDSSMKLCSFGHTPCEAYDHLPL